MVPLVILVQVQVAVQWGDNRYAKCKKVENHVGGAGVGSQVNQMKKSSVVVIDGNWMLTRRIRRGP